VRLPEPALGATHPVNRLREVSAVLEAACEGLAPHQRAHVAWLLDGLRQYDDRAALGVSLDAALGLSRRSGPGQWWNAERIVLRDRALRDIARRHYPALCPTAAAEAILRDLALLNRQADPPVGSATADLARAMRHGAIPGIRMLREILSMEIKTAD
jgi:hypothetical protein